MERWTKVAMVGIVVLGAIGGVAALRATCVEDPVVHSLIMQPRGQQPGSQNSSRYFVLDNGSFSRLPMAGQDLITVARDKGRSVTVDWDVDVERTVDFLQNVSEEQTGDPFVYVFQWSDEFFLYSEEIEVRSIPAYCA